MNKPVVVGIGLLLLAAGIWVYSQKSAEEEVRRQLADANLVGVVAYEDVSYNPVSGTLTIHEPKAVQETAGFGDDDFRIRALRIHDVADEEGTPTRFHIEVVGLEYDVLKLARQNPAFQVPGTEALDISPLEMLVTLGYRAMESNFNIEYDYDPAGETLDLNLVLGTREMGAVNLALSLGNVSQQVIQFVAGLGDSVAGAEPGLALLGRLGPAMETLEKVTLADLHISYDDDQFLKRLKRYQAVEYEYRHQQELPNEDLDGLFKEIHDDLLKSGVQEAMATNFAENIVNFTRDPRRISLSTNIEAPVRLASLIGKSPGSTLTLLKVELDS